MVMKSFDDGRYPHSELTGRIIAAAKAVHDEMRPGLDEVLYERAVCIELAECLIPFEQQKEYGVYYKSHYLGKLRPDLVINEKVILDLKVVETISETHIAQMLGYLAITGIEVGLIINYKHAHLQIKRVANLKKNPSGQDIRLK
jgi:GxxExxY protein